MVDDWYGRKDRPVRLDVRCPRCHQHPAVRVYPASLPMYAHQPADRPVMSVQCPRCGTRYAITAGAFHRAA